MITSGAGGRATGKQAASVAEDDLRRLMALLKELARARPPEAPEPPGSRLIRQWRLRRLLPRLERDWPGGFTTHAGGEVVYVPQPLDARGRRALLYPPRAHPAALACLRPGAVAIDIGASLGEWTLPLARAVGAGGRVLAVEAAPGSAAALGRTLLANGLRQAEILCVAVGDTDGTADFAVPFVTSAKSDTGTAHLGAAGAGEATIGVTLRRLDSLAAERQLPRLDLIKIDVEGAERRVLDGAAEVLDRFRPVLVVETGHEGPGDRAAIHQLLRRLGYQMLGILLDYGIAEADWAAYVAARRPFRAGDAHNLLLIPQEQA
jgi:FkbM family methyltransferase